MKIAHVTATFLPYYSGTGLVCYHSALELARRGHKVTVFTAAYPPGEYSYPPEIDVQRLPILFRFGNAPLLPDLLKVKDFDIIHLHYPFIFGAEMIALSSRLRKIPFVMTHHNDLVGLGFRKILFSMYAFFTASFVMGRASRLIAVTIGHTRNSQQRKLFLKYSHRVVEIPNGVDTQFFHPGEDRMETRKRLDIPSEAGVILFVGVLDQAHHYRGLNYLIETFASLPNSHMKLVIVGDGDTRPQYERKAAELDLSGKVIFIGTIPNDELPSIYRAADVVVITSSKESFGIVAIEAMACGLPVIAHDIPGVGDVITHEMDGLLTPLYGKEQLKMNIQKVLANEVLRKRMGDNGVRTVALKYSWPSIVEKLEYLYLDVIKS